ncbi:sensor histidine kinase [Paenibacillus cremeus]|uniref:Heme sensor protein HssS n=1 Tax=Paenibacillus cremeus TaxID=2163881 RepID=A0A559K6M2_9BACL|nr:HAMP domain-containing sensor histidine kinase [Paenibacillus cremeus]TVY07795.1 HAMP domain-containing protein [Paenibacillus cremeus]
MMKSLYSRVVFTFVTAVVFGLVLAFVLTSYLFSERLSEQFHSEVFGFAEDLADMYGRMNGVDLDSYLRSRKILNSYYVSLFSPAGAEKAYGYKEALKRKRTISPDMVQQVLQGERAIEQEKSSSDFVVGYPVLASNGQRYALFLQPVFPETRNNVKAVLFTSLAVVLLGGSLFIMVAARYLVDPLKLMSQSARRIAKGNFEISLSGLQRKDELGELARSFYDMAGELKQLEHMRSDFVSNVSHEIQSPLTSIAGFSKVLQNTSMSEAERNSYLAIIQAEAQRVSRLSENLLKLASLESAHHPFQPRTYELDEQLRSVIVGMEPIWSVKDIEFELDLPVTKIHADEDQLHQVWMNLLGNSLKFTPHGGTVKVKLETSMNDISVTIRDNGIGMTKEDQERIFERFYKADRARRPDESGSGLGLAIVKKIVDLHHGTIRVTSEWGKGSAFTVVLPGFQTLTKKK